MSTCSRQFFVRNAWTKHQLLLSHMIIHRVLHRPRTFFWQLTYPSEPVIDKRHSILCKILTEQSLSTGKKCMIKTWEGHGWPHTFTHSKSQRSRTLFLAILGSSTTPHLIQLFSHMIIDTESHRPRTFLSATQDSYGHEKDTVGHTPSRIVNRNALEHYFWPFSARQRPPIWYSCSHTW